MFLKKVKNIFILLIVSLSIVNCSKDDDAEPEIFAIPATSLISEQTLENASPLITTAVYKVIDGVVDRSINFIEDDIANGTVSSAQYKGGKFIFVPVNPSTGEFTSPISLDTNTANFGEFKITEVDGKQVRELFDTNFGYTNQREIVELTSERFTYSFQPQGSQDTFYVEHEPYNVKFPQATFSEELTAVINERFNLIP